MESLPVTSGAQWRKNREEGELIQLPYSGNFIRIRTVRPDYLLKLGKIPQVLSSLVLDMIYDRVKEGAFDAFLITPQDAEEAKEMVESLNIVFKAGVVAPKVVDFPAEDDEISCDDVDLGDRSYVFRLVFAPAEALATFRYQPPSDVDVVANGVGDPQPSL